MRRLSTVDCQSHIVLPDLGDVQLELAGHGGVVHDLVVGVGDHGPIVSLVQLQHNAGLAVTIPNKQLNHVDLGKLFDLWGNYWSNFWGVFWMGF